MRKSFLLAMKKPLWLILVLLSLSFVFQPLRAQQTHTVTGTVVDSATGNAIPHASIRVKGSRRGVAADDQGHFTITLPNAAAMLIISGASYTPVEVPATGGTINVRLVNVNQQLNEVVVVGYGTQKKATLTGAITTVNSKVFQDRGPISNPFEAIQGQAPGVIVTRTSGQPGRENGQFFQSVLYIEYRSVFFNGNRQFLQYPDSRTGYLLFRKIPDDPDHCPQSFIDMHAEQRFIVQH